MMLLQVMKMMLRKKRRKRIQRNRAHQNQPNQKFNVFMIMQAVVETQNVILSTQRRLAKPTVGMAPVPARVFASTVIPHRSASISRTQDTVRKAIGVGCATRWNMEHMQPFNLFDKVWTQENEPSQWRNTNIVQIYKGKGSKNELGNQRNIHTKLDVPKFFGHIVIGAAKDKIIKNMTKFQLGTKPGHRAQEHLFVMRSVIALYNLCGKALIVQLYDISKFFDREMLRDCMDSLYSNGIRGKLYRLIYEMKKETRIKVRTAVGVSKEENTGEGVGQGTLDGAIISACSINYSVNEFFSRSCYEISYGGLNLQPLLYQDDIFRMSSDHFSAQIGNELIHSVMETKLLDFNLDKSCYLIIGAKDAQKQIREMCEQNPLKLSGGLMKEVKEEKYLGDYISTEGLAKSTYSTINKRSKKVMNALTEIRAVIEDSRAQVNGGIVSGL